MLIFVGTEHPSYAVFLLRDLDTQRVYRLCDFTKAQLIWPSVAPLMAGKVNSAQQTLPRGRTVRPDTKHAGSSTIPVTVDGAGGSPIG